MASIKGIELKSIKYGNEKAEHLFKANIYLKNKKIGEVQLLNNENNLIYNWKNEEAYKEFLLIAKEYEIENPINIKILNDEDILINDLLELNELEKEFKRVFKKGAKLIAFLKYNNKNTNMNEYNVIKEDIILGLSEWNNDIERKIIANHNPLEIKLYSSMEDFIIK